MARSRKNRNGRRKRKRPELGSHYPLPKMEDTDFINLDDLEEVIKKTKILRPPSASTTYETPYGPLVVSDDLRSFYRIKNETLLSDIGHLKENIDTKNDYLGAVVEYEKLRDKYPNEPLVHLATAEYYEKLKQPKKYVQLVQDNFEKFVGHPGIDLAYAFYMYKQKGVVTDSMNGELSLHELYPSYSSFTPEFIIDYYRFLSSISYNKKDLATARKCADLVKVINPKKSELLTTRADYLEFPKKRRKMNLFLAAVALVLLALAGGVIWLFIRLLKWIF